MNRLTLPSILSLVVIIAGIFAFLPVQESSTTHNTLIDTLGGLDVFVFPSGPSPFTTNAELGLAASTGVVDAGDGSDDVNIDVLVLDASGDGVTGLDVADFTFTFTARDAGGAMTESDGDFAEVADGLYTFTADGDDDLGADGNSLAYMITVVVNDVAGDDTNETGTGVAPMNVIITE